MAIDGGNSDSSGNDDNFFSSRCHGTTHERQEMRNTTIRQSKGEETEGQERCDSMMEETRT